MKDIAIAIMVVGLCFYQGYLKSLGREADWVVAGVALIGAITLLIN